MSSMTVNWIFGVIGLLIRQDVNLGVVIDIFRCFLTKSIGEIIGSSVDDDVSSSPELINRSVAS